MFKPMHKQSSPFEFSLLKRDADGKPTGKRVNFVVEEGRKLARHFNDDGAMRRN